MWFIGHPIVALSIDTDEPPDELAAWAETPDPVVLHDVNSLTIDTHPD